MECDFYCYTLPQNHTKVTANTPKKQRYVCTRLICTFVDEPCLMFPPGMASFNRG